MTDIVATETLAAYDSASAQLDAALISRSDAVSVVDVATAKLGMVRISALDAAAISDVSGIVIRPTQVILSMPTTPKARRMTLTLRANTQQFADPTGRSVSMRKLPGARWAVLVELPPMKRVQAAAWCAFLTRCNGRAGRFYCGDLAAGATPPSAMGTVYVIASRTEDPTWGSRTLIYSYGWTTVGTVLSAGDYISYDTSASKRELRKLTAAVIVPSGQAYGASGYGQLGYGYQEADLHVIPTMSEQLAAETVINYLTPTAVMRLVDDEQAGWDIETALIYGIRFSAEEVWA